MIARRTFAAPWVLAAALAGCGHAPAEGEEPPSGDPVEEVRPERLFQTGLELANRGDLVRAEQYVSAAMDRGYPEAEALPVLIRICVASSRLRVALGYAEPHLQAHPDDWSLRYLVASIHLGMGHPARARQELERVVETAPEQPDPHYLLALVLRDETGDVDAAERHFRRYLELAPEGEHAAAVRDALDRVRTDMPPAPEGAADATGEGEGAAEDSGDDAGPSPPVAEASEGEESAP